MKRVTMLICIFMFMTLITGCNNQPSNQKIDLVDNNSLNEIEALKEQIQKLEQQLDEVMSEKIDDDINFFIIETSSEFDTDDISSAFNVTDTLYVPHKAELPILNDVEPKGFYYLEGALLVYIFESDVECNKALENIHEVFNEEKLMDSGLIEFPLIDFKPYFYKANNALVAYVPKYTTHYKINRIMQQVPFLKEAGDKGLSKEMLNILSNLGLSYEEVLDLSQADIDSIFAPGTHLDGGGFDPNEEQKAELAKIGLDTPMAVILYNLGYEYEEMLVTAPEEIDFIFPNTELIDNLVAKGYNEQEVQIWAVIPSDKIYKEIIKEAMQLAEEEID